MKKLKMDKEKSAKHLGWAVLVLLAAMAVTSALAEEAATPPLPETVPTPVLPVATTASPEQVSNPSATEQVVTQALDDTGLYTACLNTRRGTLYNIKNGREPMAPCDVGVPVVSFYDNTTVKALEARIARLESLLEGVTRSGNEIYINGANLHIRSGSGSTYGAVNGLGNLIIGYNEPRGCIEGTCGVDDRTGSHNLVLGSKNNYKSYGGLVAGNYNEISGSFASVSGGGSNTASGDYSSVSGGHGNKASGFRSSISGGYGNIASGYYSSVSGGEGNIASGYYSSISGGNQNTASDSSSSVSGGYDNIASGSYSSISGGYINTASGYYSSVSGGNQNIASGDRSSVSGGFNNIASGDTSSVSGGYQVRSAIGTYDWAAGALWQEQ